MFFLNGSQITFTGTKKAEGGLGRFQKLITTRRDPIRIGRFCQCVKLL